MLSIPNMEIAIVRIPTIPSPVSKSIRVPAIKSSPSKPLMENTSFAKDSIFAVVETLLLSWLVTEKPSLSKVSCEEDVRIPKVYELSVAFKATSKSAVD